MNRINITLTPTAQEILDSQADQLHITRSELIERLARGQVKLNQHQVKEALGESLGSSLPVVSCK